MKKGIIVFLLLVAIFVTACGGSSKSSRTVEDLFDQYAKAYTTANLKLAQDLFPPYYIEYAKDLLTQDRLDNSLKNAKEIYGDDFTITYKINEKTKLTDDELDTLNKGIASTFKTEDKASECYKLDGTITFKGSDYEDTDPISTMKYCKYDSGWYLVGSF